MMAGETFQEWIKRIYDIDIVAGELPYFCPPRHKPGNVRPGITGRQDIHGTSFYITMSFYENGEPAEVFVTFDPSVGMGEHAQRMAEMISEQYSDDIPKSIASKSVKQACSSCPYPNAFKAMFDALAISLSIAWQHGVDWNLFVDKFEHITTGLGGFASTAAKKMDGTPIRSASSALDLFAKWVRYTATHIHQQNQDIVGQGDDTDG